MIALLETQRLRLRKFDLTDTAFILELLNSPGWLQFIGDRNVHSKEEAEKYLLNGPLKSYEENGFGLSMVIRKEDDLPIGMCGLLKRETLPHPDIGFAFLPDHSGKGYAIEITQALINHARAKWKIAKILAITLPTNQRSIHLLEKLGFRCEDKSIQQGSETLMLFEN
jgi:RimJ/RimL family protein N-acetyltransferase